MLESARIAVDFDNTIVDYDALFPAAARARGLPEGREAVDKASLRRLLRARPGGEEAWQAVQADVYGTRIALAPPYAGCAACLARLRARGAQIFVVSHKTRFAAAAPDGPDLRAAARAWLEANAFLGPDMIAPERVFFEATRAEKLARLRALAVSLVIDDLVEVLGDPGFPAGVRRWLFAPNGARPGPWEAFPSWAAIDAALP